jgi:glycosyltransferase involved in cell wall biosynthesis
MISVIITGFNDDRQFLWQAIQSCKDQDVDTEVIVVDCGSDNSPNPEIIEDIYQNADLFIRTKINLKQSGAMNLGIKNAKHSYIITLDADNYLYPNVLGSMVRAMAGNASVVCGNITNDFMGEVIRPQLAKGYDLETFKSCNPVFTSSLFRKTAWELVGGFDNVFYTDYNFWCKLYMKGCHFEYINKLIYNHTIRKNSASWNNIDKLDELNQQARRPLLCTNRV